MKNDIDIKKLLKEHPNDPRIGQGFNDARGDFADTELHDDYKNRKNHTGPEQKKPRSPDVAVVRVSDTATPNKDLRVHKKGETHHD